MADAIRNRVNRARSELEARNAVAPLARYNAKTANLDAVRRRQHADGWCILRTNGRRTLALAQSLIDAGIEAWTPRETIRKRLPRGRKGFREIDRSIVPSFAFVRASHLPDVVRALSMHDSPHPKFTIFQHAGRVPVIADRDMGYLRIAEDRARLVNLRTKRPDVSIGQIVRPTHGAFAGLNGIVESVKGGTAHVCFNDTFRVKIATWLLLDHHVGNDTAYIGTAA